MKLLTNCSCCDPPCRPAIALTCRRWRALLFSEPLLWSTLRIETAQLDFLSRRVV